jgi:hypothetical protein
MRTIRRTFCMTRSVPAMLTLVATLAVAPAAPRLKDRPMGYFPTRVRMVWMYDEDGHQETRIITHVQDEGSTKVLTVKWTRTLHQSTVETVQVSARGVFRMGFADNWFERPWCMMKFPPTSGDTWDYDVAGEMGTATVHGPETIEVPAGKFTVYRVECKGQRGGGLPTKSTYWFADIGLVKQVDNLGETLVLKSYRPGASE